VFPAAQLPMIALQGGATPYYTSYVNGLVKLTYNASYRFREVYE